MIEEWRDTEYTGYQVSNLGRVKSFKKYYDSNGRIMGLYLINTKEKVKQYCNMIQIIIL